MYLTQDYKDIIELFNKYQVRFLVAGAYAMSKVGYSRSTYDIDLWVEKSEKNAENILKALEDFGVHFQIEPKNLLEANSVL
jgi:Cys-tRNA synthase (O-phospho-L-seryl-tRNA:Cys-tRNA synthase)